MGIVFFTYDTRIEQKEVYGKVRRTPQKVGHRPEDGTYLFVPILLHIACSGYILPYSPQSIWAKGFVFETSSVANPWNSRTKIQYCSASNNHTLRRRINVMILMRIFCGLLFLIGMTLSICAAELPGKGIVFDGNTAYELKSDDVSVDSKAFSVAAWVKPDRVDRSLVFLSMGSPQEDFTFYFYNGVVRMLVANQGSSYNFATAPAPKIGTATHYAGTYDGETIRIYENGVLKNAKPAPSDGKPFTRKMYAGGIPGMDRSLSGTMDDISLWNRTLTPDEIKTVFEKGSEAAGDKLAVRLMEKIETATASPEVLINAKDTGFRGIWYYNQKLNNEYVFKYSGGLGTYCTNHYPFSIYAPKVDKTFFCYGGTNQEAHDNDEQPGTLLHEISYFDHKTGKVAKPTILLDKRTDDAHDNPVMSIDENGYIWIFSTSHGVGRPSYISRSKKPYDIEEFELVPATKMVDGQKVPLNNFSYFQIWNVPGKGFIVFFTTYDKSILNDPASRSARTACFMTSRDGVEWSAWQPLAGIVHGHYQNGAVWQDKKVGTSFNYHPNDPPRVGLNYRTNLYYMESQDFGKTWQTADGKPLTVPLRDDDIECDALVRDYRSQQLNVYVMDMVYDNEGHPVILYVTSKGFESGPENGPRIWHVAHWNGSVWTFSDVTEADNNYDYGSLFIDKDDKWQIIGTSGFGPQEYNTGGEVSLWESLDRGKTWTMKRQMTDNSEVNHCFPRRTIGGHPEFKAIWADGHGRQKSKSRLYFCDENGDVFRLPEKMTADMETSEKM